MPLVPVFSGDYSCPECEQEFKVQRVSEDDLVCPKCGVDLEEVEDDEDDEEDEDEEQEDA